jgi:hypothetical protein
MQNLLKQKLNNRKLQENKDLFKETFELNDQDLYIISVRKLIDKPAFIEILKQTYEGSEEAKKELYNIIDKVPYEVEYTEPDDRAYDVKPCNQCKI